MEYTPVDNDQDYTDYDPAIAAGVGGIAGAIPGLNIFAPGIAEAIGQGSASKARAEMIKNAKGLQLPSYDKSGFVNQEYSGDFNPEMYSTPESAQYQTINEDPKVRAMQIQALQNMQGYADQSANSQQALDRQSALNNAQILAKQQMGAIQNQAARRGQLGSGLDYVLQNQSAQQGANSAQQGYLNSAAQAALQRLQGTQGVMQGSSQLRGQDFNTANTNAGIINAFNMANTNARNAVNQANTGFRNGSSLRNLDARQGNQNANVGIRNNGILRNDSNANSLFGASLQRLNALNGAIGGQAQQGDAVGAKANAAGKQGYGNFKDLMTMGAGGFGG